MSECCQTRCVALTCPSMSSCADVFIYAHTCGYQTVVFYITNLFTTISLPRCVTLPHTPWCYVVNSLLTLRNVAAPRLHHTRAQTHTHAHTRCGLPLLYCLQLERFKKRNLHKIPGKETIKDRFDVKRKTTVLVEL